MYTMKYTFTNIQYLVKPLHKEFQKVFFLNLFTCECVTEEPSLELKGAK